MQNYKAFLEEHEIAVEYVKALEMYSHVRELLLRSNAGRETAMHISNANAYLRKPDS
jgi:hypothetical protein